MLWFWWVCCHNAQVERQKQLSRHTYKMGCQCGSFFEWNKASPLATWLAKTPLASFCSEHFKLPCSQVIQLHQVWLLSQQVCDAVWVLCKIERHGLEECEEEEANRVWRFLECLKGSIMLVWDAGDVMCSLLVSSCSCCNNSSSNCN